MNLLLGHSAKIDACFDMSSEAFKELYLGGPKLSDLICFEPGLLDSYFIKQATISEVSSNRLLLENDDVMIDLKINQSIKQITQLEIIIVTLSDDFDLNSFINGLAENCDSINNSLAELTH